MDESKIGLHILHNVISLFPQLVNAVSWAGIAIGCLFFYFAWQNGKEYVKANAGIKQDEHHLKKMCSYGLFGLILFRVEWMLAVIVASLGVNSTDSKEYVDYLSGDIFAQNAGMSDLLSYVLWICNMIGFIGFLMSIVKANYAVIQPQPKAGSKAILLFAISIALLRLKEVLIFIASLAKIDYMLVWLGY